MAQTLLELPQTDKPSPKEVLFEQMYFLRNQFNKILKQILVQLKEDNNAIAALELIKIQNKVRAELVDVANKLAPYTDPKLESIELKTTETVRFVVEAPIPMKSTKDFMDKMGANKSPIILGEGATFDILTDGSQRTIVLDNQLFKEEDQSYSDDDVKPEYFDED